MYKLYHTYTSPYVRKVVILLHDLNLIDQCELVNRNTTMFLPSPLGKIPVLETIELGPIFDSSVICEYLDNKHAPGKYFPNTSLASKFKTLTIYATAQGVLDAAVQIVGERRRPSELISKDEIEKQVKKIKQGFIELERNVSHFKTSFDIATITTIVALDYVQFRHSDLVNIAEYKALGIWRASVDAPAITLTMPRES